MIVYRRHSSDGRVSGPCEGSPERPGTFTGQSGVYHQSDQVNNFSCPTAGVSGPPDGLNHVAPESARRKTSHKSGGGADAVETASNSPTPSPDNRETACNITGSSPSPPVLLIPTR